MLKMSRSGIGTPSRVSRSGSRRWGLGQFERAVVPMRERPEAKWRGRQELNPL